MEKEFSRLGWFDELGELSDLFFEENPAFKKVLEKDHVRFRCDGEVPRLFSIGDFSIEETLACDIRAFRVGELARREQTTALDPVTRERLERLERSLDSSLSWFLESLLATDPSWDPGSGFIDGLATGEIKMKGPRLLEAEGLMTTTGTDSCVTDPFCALIKLSADGLSLESYTIRFGDAHSPRRRSSSDCSWRRLNTPKNWAFVFTKAEDG